MAHDPASMEDVQGDLQELLLQRYAAGVTATLEADPKAAVPGTTIVIRAVIFADAQQLAVFTPVLRCKDVADFADMAFGVGALGVGFKEYATKVRSTELKVNHTYQFTLHPRPDAGPIAGCTVHIFKKDIVAAARRQMREIISGPPSRKAVAARRRRR